MTIDTTSIQKLPTAILTKSKPAFPNSSPISYQLSNLTSEETKLLHSASVSSQALRRQIARDAHVLIVRGGFASKRFIYERIRELGCKITMLEDPSSPLRVLLEEGIVDNFVEMDFSTNSNAFQRAMEALSNTVGCIHFDAVTTYFERAVPLAASIADAFGVAINTVQACDNARNKRRTRQVMAAAGFPTPRFFQISSNEQIAQACEKVGFPAVMKPSYGANSFGVVCVESTIDAIGAYNKLTKSMLSSGNDIYAQGVEVLMEELYEGDEFDCDVLLSDGSVVYAKILDNWACCPPFFLETGRNAPSTYPNFAQKEMIKLATDTVLALGFKGGVLHVELMYTSQGPRIIEVNARLGGGSVRNMHLYTWGVDLAEEHVLCALGIPIRPVIPEVPSRYLAESLINAPYTGTISHHDWLGFTRSDPHLFSISYKKKKGDRVLGPENGPPDYLARLVVTSSKSGYEACKIAEHMVSSKATVPIVPDRETTKCSFFFPATRHPFQ